MRRFVLALSLVSCFAPLQGATLERLTLDDMIAKATSIVRGRVSSAAPVMKDAWVFTSYRVEVSERWKGTAASSVEFLVPGGTLGGVRQSYAGAPALTGGQEYLLFLWTSEQSGATYIIGYTQGLFSLPRNATGDATALRPASRELMLEPGSGKIIRDQRIEMSLRDMSARISAVLAKSAK